MASVKVIMRNIESGDIVVMEFSEDDVVPHGQVRAAGWEPVLKNGHLQVVQEARESDGRPAGYKSAAAYLRP